MRSPHLAIVYVDWMEEDLFHDLVENVVDERLELLVESRESEVYASVEWLLPTAAVIYISKSYFDGFLKEMGKDHYALLKKGVKALWAKMLGPKAPELDVVSSPGKVSREQPYSLVYSIMAETGQGSRFKLLFPRGLSESEYEHTVDAFLDFLAKFHSQELDAATQNELKSARVVGGTLLLVYDSALNSIRTLDPIRRGTGEA